MSDLFSRAADLSRLTRSGTDLVQQVQTDEAEANIAAQKAANDAAAAAQAAAQLQQQEQTLQQQTQHASDLVAQLDSQEAATRSEITAADSQSLAVAEQIAQTRITQLDDTIAQAEQAAWDEATYYVQNHLGSLPPSIAQPPAAPVDANGSQLSWPAHGVAITQGFGPVAYPFEPPFDGFPHFHTGIDLAAPLGQPVYAAADGVVVAASRATEGYGDHVIIAHDSHTFTLYGHLESFAVKPGDTVHQGQLIGMVGSTGNSTGPHTHFEVRVDGTPTDPAPYLPPLPQGAKGPPAQQ
jgi:murein DD-endopeptidase MepM/ murein hydrolase activator NlpD